MGQLAGLLYKNLKIQSKNKCGVLCQLFTPLICLLIIFGLQNLVDSLDMNPDKPNLSYEGLLNNNHHNDLLKGFQPSIAKDLLRSVNELQERWNDSQFHIEGESQISNEEMVNSGIIEEEKYKFKSVKGYKLMDDIKIPFNMIVPLNLPIDFKTMKKFLKDKFILRSCYKFFKFGVKDSDFNIKNYLINHLRFENDFDPRKTTCQMTDKHKKLPPVQVPNVRYLEDTTTKNDINKRMFEEISKMETYDLFNIEKQIEPSDGYMVFEKANDKEIKGTFSANNIQFFAYHHDNYMNMAVTSQFIRIYMNTETYLTMIDMISNNYLQTLNLSSSELEANQNKLFMKQFGNLVNSLSLEDIIKFRNEYKPLNTKFVTKGNKINF